MNAEPALAVTTASALPGAPQAAARAATTRAALGAAALVASLGARPFTLSAAQLTAIGADDLVEGEQPGPLASVVACRYASLVADHVSRDLVMTAPGAPGAYATVWECAREAFVRDLHEAATAA